jgi:hypothetical protein
VDVYALSLKLQADGQRQVESALKSVGKNMTVTAGLAKAAGAAIGTAIVGTLALVIKNASEADRSMAQLRHTLTVTGNAAGFTFQQLQQQAAELQKLTIFGDDQIMVMQSGLARFSNIANDTFIRTQKAILDVASTGKDLEGTMLQLGKAINDPARAAALLRKQNITLSAAQEQLVDQMVKTNNVAGAQAVLLDAIEGKYKGMAETARKTLPGALKALNNAFGDMFEAQGITEALRGEVEKLIAILQDPKNIEAVQRFAVLITGTLSRMVQFIADLLHDMTVVFQFFVRAFAALPAPENSPLRQYSRYLDDVRAALNAAGRGAESFTDAMRKVHGEIGKAPHLGMADIPGLFPSSASGPAQGVTPVIKAEDVDYDRWMRAGYIEFAEQMKEAADRRARDAEKKKPLELMVPVQPKFDVAQFADALEASEQELIEAFAGHRFGEAVGATLVESLANGIEQAVASGRLGEGFKALGATLLSGLGDAMMSFGKASVGFATLMNKIKVGLATLNPGAALAASVALIGIGAALKGAARGMFGGGGGGGFGGGGLALAGGGRMNDTFTRVTFGPTNANVAAGMEPRGAINITVIGPNDPQAQRQIQELISKGARR